ncbi:hypothetical protein DL768_009804 [Monosporascus sp. mg162]|nr:hypothetical protein DL768_009804 [Monosporascus sp. mg162]
MTEDKNWAYNSRIEAIRDDEYPMLKGNPFLDDDGLFLRLTCHTEAIYLDHAGTTPYARSLMDKFAADMTSNLFGNPHSASASSQTSTSRIDDIRLRVLQFFNADPLEFDLVFVANATAGIKLVADALRCVPGGFNYLYHQASHTSVVGVRQEARNSQCLDDAAIDGWLEGDHSIIGTVAHSQPTLFAYPAQSNMDGWRFPLNWASRLRRYDQTYTLLDAASYVSTSPLDLSDADGAPDFTVLSFYKIFGFPDLGGLIVRRQAIPVFQHRRYFGGGTVDMVVCLKEQWHASKTQSLHEALEDGTLPVHSIVALDSALNVHRSLFGSMQDIASHTSFLARRLYRGLSVLRHYNGEDVCTIYSRTTPGGESELQNGPIVAFNLRNPLGAWISLTEFEKLAVLKQFHIRTGGVCNPGGIAFALDLQPWEMKRNFSAGFRCGNETDIIGGKPTGVIRASLGAMSTVSDVDKFIKFIDEFYRTPSLKASLAPAMPDWQDSVSDLYVESITVYPIKSCGGYRVPKAAAWEVRPEGLAWDREWCLVHRGTGQALSQKRYPRMALIRPSIDFSSGLLRVSYTDISPNKVEGEITVPLSADPTVFSPLTASRHAASRVCGEEISAQIYTSNEINDFFSDILDVPCALARFPPGGLGKSMRHAKAHLQKHQNLGGKSGPELPAGAAGVVTPPDSGSETERRRILLSNESPILAINKSSLGALNDEIGRRGGRPVSAEVFRANFVIAASSSAASGSPSAPDSFAYSEDHWSRLRIGRQDFEMLGSCRRCHMVCIDQETARKSEEPFVSLTRTRRFDGKVFFGTHMCHVAPPDSGSRQAQFPTVSVGDKVLVDPI